MQVQSFVARGDKNFIVRVECENDINAADIAIDNNNNNSSNVIDQRPLINASQLIKGY